MVYRSPFLRLVMSGTTYGEEIFSCGLTLAQNFDGPVVQPANLTPYADACKAWFARATTEISSQAKLTMIKLNVIGVDGKYANAGDSFFQDILPVVPGARAVSPVPQITQAVTLMTAASRGLASKGRLYPPMFGGGMTSGQAFPAGSLATAESMVTFINALNAIGPGDVAVVSNQREGAMRPVTRVRVGVTIDTQRRRRNQLPENYQLSATPVVAGP